MSSSVFLLLMTASPVLLLALLAAALHQHKKSASHFTPVIGATGFVEKDFDPEGAVIVNGELFRARLNSSTKLTGPARVRVIAARDHLLIVEPAP